MNLINRNKIFLSTYIVLFTFWLFVAVFRMSIDFSYLKKDMTFIFKTNEQRRVELYGETYILFSQVNNETSKNAKILFVTNNQQTFFLGRYLIYPKLLYWSAESRNSKSLTDYSYLLIYHPRDYSKSYLQHLIKDYKIKSQKTVSIGSEKEAALLITIK